LVSVERVGVARDEIVEALGELIPQLNPALSGPSARLVEQVVADSAVTLLVARVDGRIVGSATVGVITTPTWINAHVNDVVVLEGARGQGVGRELMEAAIQVARERGAQVVRLTSAERRGEAHRLYESLGFQHTGSRAYRLDL
jgi:GNAT superfamily N-acetyltransferase